MINRHIKASESFVIHELEKIARNTGLVKEDPIIEKTASLEEEEEDDVVMLEDSGDLIADVAVLASELRDRGFIKQAERLEEKAFILKKAMSDGGHKSLYEFWKETGEAVVNFAHKTDDADVAGYKPKNLNEVRKSVLQNLNQAPTGKDKAVRMAQKVGYLLKKMADDGAVSASNVPHKVLIKYRNFYDKEYNLINMSKNIDSIKRYGYLNEKWEPENKELKYEHLEPLSFLHPSIANQILKEIPQTSASLIYYMVSGKVSDLAKSSSSLASLAPIASYVNISVVGGLAPWKALPWVASKLLYDSGESVDPKAAAAIKSVGATVTVELNSNGQNFVNKYLNAFFTISGLYSLITKYVNSYLSKQEEFIGLMGKYFEIKNKTITVQGTLSKLKEAISSIDPKSDEITKINAAIEELDRQVKFPIDRNETSTITEFLDSLAKLGIDSKALDQTNAEYTNTINELKRQK